MGSMNQTALTGVTTSPSKPLIAVLVLLNAVAPFSIDMYLAAFPQLAQEFNASASMIQLTLTAFLVGMASGQLLIGNLSDRYGRRRPLIVGSSVCLIASMLCIVAMSIEVLICLRFVQGFAGAAGIVIARAIISDRTSGLASARLFAMLIGIGVLVPAAAPVLGGVIVTAFGWRAVFVALAVMNLTTLFGVILFADESLPEDRRRPCGLKALASSTRSVLCNRHYIGYAMTIAFTTSAMFGYISASPFVLQNIIGLSPAGYSAVIGICSLAVAAGSVAATHVVDKISPRPSAIGGLTVLLIITALLLLTVTVGHVLTWATIALMACFMASVGFNYANTTTLAMAEVRHTAGTGSALLGFLQYGAGALTPPLVGIAGHRSAVPMGIVMSSATLAALAALLLLTRGPAPSNEHLETLLPTSASNVPKTDSPSAPSTPDPQNLIQ
jgi:MFS transporter, DHA1 family, multidrug resistance protein